MTEREETLARLVSEGDQTLKEVHDGHAAIRRVSRLTRELGGLYDDALDAGDVSVAHTAYRLRRRLRMAVGLPGGSK